MPTTTTSDCLNRDSWLTFLDSEVLTNFDAETGLIWARSRLLSQAEEDQLNHWRGWESGPAPDEARRFLGTCGIDFLEFEQFCRDHWLQPWQDLQLPLDWFAGWLG